MKKVLVCVLSYHKDSTFYVENSATRFGKMLPLWQNYAHLLVKFEGLFNIWQNVDPTLVTFFVQKRFKNFISNVKLRAVVVVEWSAYSPSTPTI